MQEATIDSMRRLIEQLRPGWRLPVDIGPDTHLTKTLGLTSLELVGLLFLCQRTFNVTLITTDDVMTSMQTVGQAVSTVRAQQGAAMA